MLLYRYAHRCHPIYQASYIVTIQQFDGKTLANHSLQSFDEENLQIYNSLNTEMFL